MFKRFRFNWRRILQRFKVIVFYGGKGGVGKSLTTANFAIWLSKKGYKVLIEDGDLETPSLSVIFGLDNIKHKTNRKNHKVDPIVVDNYPNIKIISMSAMPFIDNDNGIFWDETYENNFIRQCIVDVNLGKIDYLLIDLPAGLSKSLSAFKNTLKKINHAVIITQGGNKVVDEDVSKAINCCKDKELNIPILGVIENMSGVTNHGKKVLCNCGCGKPVYPLGHGSGKILAEKYDIPYLGRIALDEQINLDIAKGDPEIKNTDLFDRITNHIIKKRKKFL